jgi:hypothetical protein
LAIYLVTLVVFEIWVGLVLIVLWNNDGDVFNIKVVLEWALALVIILVITEALVSFFLKRYEKMAIILTEGFSLGMILLISISGKVDEFLCLLPFGLAVIDLGMELYVLKKRES